MDFAIPQDLEDYYAELEAFIENTIEPMVAKDDNIRFFDHRREDARTDWERGGLPSHDWKTCCVNAARRQTQRDTGVSRRRRNMAVGMAPTCGWP